MDIISSPFLLGKGVVVDLCALPFYVHSLLTHGMLNKMPFYVHSLLTHGMLNKMVPPLKLMSQRRHLYCMYANVQY